MTDSGPEARRVIAYVDGFNLYFGLRDSGWQRYYWLDLEKLVRSVLPPGSVLAGVKYFTARVTAPEEKRKRQALYLEALQAATSCELFFGKYQMATHFCQNCFHEARVPTEKMTDVNIAVEMMADAFADRFDVAMLISGDSDLTPPVAAVRRLFPAKGVLVALPPKRHSTELVQAASASFVIARTRFRDSQLPERIRKPDGYELVRPAKWR